jgi:hypothetical protein
LTGCCGFAGAGTLKKAAAKSAISALIPLRRSNPARESSAL